METTTVEPNAMSDYPPSDDTEGERLLDGPAVEETRRERSTIRFPYGDLSDAVEIAKKIHEQHGLSCTLDQLAATMHSTTSSGAFRTKVSTAVTFGVVTVARKVVSLTELGLELGDPQTEARGRVHAFLRVPLYNAIFDLFRGGRLPGGTGLEAEMVKLGVAEKQAMRARQAFQRSAQQAGFFQHGRDRLVEPSIGRLPDKQPATEGPAVESGTANDGGEGAPMSDHPLIKGLIARLPAEGDDFSKEQLNKWLGVLRSNLELIYNVEADSVTDPSKRTIEHALPS